MRIAFNFIRCYLLNGAYAYALFGVYSLTVSPFVTRFIDYGDKNLFVSIFGFVMLIAEFFALNFKLKMVKMRSEQKRIAYKKETGIDIIPSVTPIVFFAFFMGLVFNAAIIMIAMTALGYNCTEEKMSSQGSIVLVLGIIIEIFAFGYIYVTTGFYTDEPQNKKELADDIKEDEDWDKANAQLSVSDKYFRLEMLSDIVLQVFTLMLFTAFWQYINQMGINILHDALKGNKSALEAAFSLFSMLLAMVILGLMPMRIAYWIEDSMDAFTRREKSGVGILFIIVAVFTCSPAIYKFITLFILGFPASSWEAPMGYGGYLLSIALFLTLLLMQILLFGKKELKTK